MIDDCNYVVTDACVITTGTHAGREESVLKIWFEKQIWTAWCLNKAQVLLTTLTMALFVPGNYYNVAMYYHAQYQESESVTY